jgi:hypothetical protein
MRWEQFAFIVFETAVLAYFLLMKKPFSVFALAAFSWAFYMLPLAVGVVPKMGVTGPEPGVLLTLDPRVYILGFGLGATTVVSSALYEKMNPARRAMSGSEGRSASAWYIGIAVAALAMHASQEPLFFVKKSELLKSLGHFFVLFETCISLAAVDAFYHRRWPLFAAAICLLVLDLAIGFRLNAVIVALACVLIWLSRQGAIRLVSRLHVYAGIGIAILAVGILANPIRLYGPVAAIESLADSHHVHNEFFRLEPFVTQSVANETLKAELSCQSLGWRQVITAILPVGRYLNFTPRMFENDYKPLFPEVTFGLAGNPWAESVCRGGWAGFAAALCLFALLLAAIQFALDRARPTFLPALAICSVIVAFYANRNDVFFTALMLRRVIYVAGAVHIASFAVRSVQLWLTRSFREG